MEFYNDKYLPDYVFTKKFDRYLFFYHLDFFGVARKFMNNYVALLKNLDVHKFQAIEISPKTNQIKVFKKYDVTVSDSMQIFKDLFGNDPVEGFSYMIDVFERVYLTVPGNSICVYFDRDLDAVIVACSKEIAGVLWQNRNELNILTLEEYISHLEAIYTNASDEEWLVNTKTKLLENYH